MQWRILSGQPRTESQGELKEGRPEVLSNDAGAAFEQGYLALSGLASSLTSASNWTQGAAAVAARLAGLDAPRAVRLWDQTLLPHAVPTLASALALLTARGADPLLTPRPLEPAADASAVTAAFAAEPKRMLHHDRVSAYMLTDGGRVFERFAVASPPIISGAGVIISFRDVWPSHVVVTNRPLVSEGLGSDLCIVGREDRIITRSGFHGLLSVPLRMRGRSIGVLNFVSRTRGFYWSEDVPIAQQLAGQVGVFVNGLWRQSRLQDTIRQQATEREREWVSREIYHVVPEIVGPARELRERLDDSDARTSERLDRIFEAASGELSQVRRALVDASPRAFDGESLRAVMESTLARGTRSGGLNTQIEAERRHERPAGQTGTVGLPRLPGRALEHSPARLIHPRRRGATRRRRTGPGRPPRGLRLRPDRRGALESSRLEGYARADARMAAR